MVERVVAGQRLERVFHIDIEHCAVCGGTLRVIACINTPELIETILTELAARETGAIHHPRAPPPGVAPLWWTPSDCAEEVFAMAKTHPPYAPEFRRQMVELVRSGRSAGELAREFGCCAQTIRNWVRQNDRDEGRRDDGLTSSELEELRRLRRENRRLREEREILKKAAVWFARETGSVPGRSSGS